IVAAAKGSAPIQTMKIYLDGISVYTVQASQINTALAMASGAHRITVKGWDNGGVIYSSSINITVGTTGAVQHSVDLIWIDMGTATAGFNVYRSPTSDSAYTKINAALVMLPTFTDTTVEAGKTYYYVVTSVDTSGVESAYSNQATALIPTP